MSRAPDRVQRPRPDGSPGVSPPRRALAHERVRFVGEAVAAVVAENREAAVDARDAIFVDYEDLPAVVNPEDAMAPGAPLVFDDAPGNIAASMRHGDAQAAGRLAVLRTPFLNLKRQLSLVLHRRKYRSALLQEFLDSVAVRRR